MSRYRILSNIDISKMEHNSEGLVEIETIINYVEPEVIRPDGDKYQKIILLFEKKNYFSLFKYYFYRSIEFRVYRLRKLFRFNKKKHMFHLNYDIEWNTYFIFEDFNEIVFNYIYYFNKYKTIYKQQNLNLMYLEDYIFFIINLKKKQPFITLSKIGVSKIKRAWSSKTMVTTSAGMLLKKLLIDEKKSKKHIKTLFLLIKLLFDDINQKLNFPDRFIFNIRGTKRRMLKLLNFCKRKLDYSKIQFIYTPNFYQNSIKFKKIRSIKRRLFKRIAYK